MPTDDRLIELYRQLYELTITDCKKKCKLGVGSCCSSEYCEMALQYARDFWDTELKPTGFPNPKGLMFLGPEGCVVAPHLRPLCTAHDCQINSLGVKPGDPEWTTAYFKLRNKIDRLEWERHESKQGELDD